MSTHWFAFVFALLVWWLGTGVVMWLGARPARTYERSLFWGALVSLAAVIALAASAAFTTAHAACVSFVCAVTIWGWHELAFLTGFVTGPTREPCPVDGSPWQRTKAAMRAIAYHESALLATLAVLVILTWDAPNQTGAWTFAALYLLRISAKLNLFLGVRNVGAELLPGHLAYMGSYFRVRAMNRLWPVSVAGCTVVAVAIASLAAGPTASDFDKASLTLIGSFVLLGLVEHLFMMAPPAVSRLWSWALAPRRDEPRG